jgi:hypothetical protein
MQMPRPRKPSGHEQRLRKNDRSLGSATHHREPWSADEVAFLLDWDGSDEELSLTAELLGRTREACRERFYKTKRGEAVAPVKSKPITVTSGIGDMTTTERYIGSDDDPDDQWWSSDYYTNRK